MQCQSPFSKKNKKTIINLSSADLAQKVVNVKKTVGNVKAFRSSLIWVHTVCLYAKLGFKSLQEYSADDINRRHFQMQFFLAL